MAAIVGGPAGPAGLYCGFSASLAGSILYRGLYFGLYDALASNMDNLALKFCTGFCVTTAAGLAVYPLTTAVKRMQVSMQPAAPINQYRGAIDCIGQIVRKEGLLALWRGAGLNAGSGVLGTIMLVGFDALKSAYISPS